MSDTLRRTGANSVILIPDNTANVTLNGSTSGDDAISTAGFVAAMWEDEEIVGDLTTLLLPPYNLSIDNVSVVGSLAGYKLNLTLPNRARYEIGIQHTTDMTTFQRVVFDTRTRAEALSVTQDNTRYTFNIASVAVPAPRNVAIGVLDTMLIEHRYDGAADFAGSNLVSSRIVAFTYAVTGQTNPILAEPA